MGNLTPDQQTALAALHRFVQSLERLFLLTGYAGTGKTTLLHRFIQELRANGDDRPIVLTAFTNKATKVLAQMAWQWKLALDTMTCCRLLGLRPVVEEETGQQVFRPRRPPVHRGGALDGRIPLSAGGKHRLVRLRRMRSHRHRTGQGRPVARVAPVGAHRRGRSSPPQGVGSGRGTRWHQPLAELAAAKRWLEFWQLKQRFHAVDHAYSLTVHKSQGSTFQDVFVDLPSLHQNRNPVERNRLVGYVAFTRAAKRLFLYCE